MSNLEQFKLHPSVIYSLIREQAGSPQKALAELVMNSIDAGAKNIHLEISAEKFSIKDDGQGFKNLNEIETFFGTFGTPHQKGDATYGQFRLGRGQCFAIAKTEWRSGLFGMTVDLACTNKNDVHGYELHQYPESLEGCEIHGEFYESLHIYEGVQSKMVFNTLFEKDLNSFSKKPTLNVFDGSSFFKRFVANICLIKGINITLNGVPVSDMLSSKGLLIAETDTAHYYHTKSMHDGIVLLNKGIYITTLGFNYPMVIDFKVSPDLNIARNQVNAECPIYIQGRKELYRLMFDAWLNEDRWANKVGKIIASGFLGNLPQFTQEFFDNITLENDRIEFAKKYMVHMVGVNEQKNISLWEALEYAKSNQVYVNNTYQNDGIAPRHFEGLVDRMRDFQDAQNQILLVDPCGVLVDVAGRHEEDAEISCGTWFSLNSNMFKRHNFFYNVTQLSNDSYSRISVKKIKPVKTNRSAEISELIKSGFSNFEVSAAWLEKNDLARQTLEDGLASFQLGIIKLLNSFCNEIPDNIRLFNNPKVTPLIVNKLRNSTVAKKMVTIDDAPYLLLTEECFARGEWMAEYLDYILGSSLDDDDDEASVYVNNKYYQAFHDHLEGAQLDAIYDGLNQVALQTSEVMVKKPIRKSRVESTKAMRQAWKVIFAADDSLLDHNEVKEAWTAFNQINV